MNLSEKLLQTLVAKNIPINNQIELLAPCNLRCSHCYVTHSKSNALSLPLLEDLFEQMQTMGTPFLTLTGGEIGLRPDLFDIIAAARARRFAVTLLSSGTLFEEKEWDMIASLGVLYVKVSLYAIASDIHDKITQVPGSHRRTMASIRGLQKRNVEVRIGCPIMNVNQHEIPNLIQFSQKERIPIFLTPRIRWTDAHNPQPTQTMSASSEQLMKLYQHPSVRRYIEDKSPSCRPTMTTSDKPCGVGEIGAFIASTGEVYPCNHWPQSAGNVLQKSFANIWTKSAVFKQTRNLTNGSLTGCSSCNLRGNCKPCAAMNLQETGAINRPSEMVCRGTEALTHTIKTAPHSQMHRNNPLPLYHK